MPALPLNAMLTFLFLAFIGYLLFRLIFDFVLPIYRTTQRVKKSFREMHDKMNGQTKNNTAPHHTTQKSPTQKKKSSNDYIDFEEVKD